MRKHSSAAGIVTLESIAVTIVVVLVVMVTIAIILTSTNSSHTAVTAPVDTLRNQGTGIQERTDVQFIPSDSAYADITTAPGESAKPFNVRLFEEQRAELLKSSPAGDIGGINASRFTIQVTRIDTSNGLVIEGKASMGGPLDGRAVVFVFSADQAAKVTYADGGSAEAIKPGDRINIDQTLDYSKESYSDSLQGVEVSVE